jgi:hypothetical protein
LPTAKARAQTRLTGIAASSPITAIDQWQLPEGTRYTRVECHSACSLWFHSANAADGNSRRAGPFSTLSAVDGVLYGDNRIIAFWDSQLNDWYSFDFDQHSRRILVSPYRQQGGRRSRCGPGDPVILGR